MNTQQEILSAKQDHKNGYFDGLIFLGN